MAYCTQAEVVTGCNELKQERIVAEMANIIADAEKEVNADISGMYEIYQIENYSPAPDTLNRLAVYRSRSIGYRLYYGKVPEGSEIQYYDDKYSKLLEDLRDRLAKIDNTSETNESKVEYV